jgi:hypothetical protein
MHTVSRRLFDVTCLMLPFFVLGCGESDRKYIPSQSIARGALEAALSAWKSGEAHGTVKSYQVPVETFDARWQAGKKLKEFEILREEPSDGPKTFVVRMTSSEDKEPQEVTYLVVGKDPLLVFRKEDYNKASGLGGG